MYLLNIVIAVIIMNKIERQEFIKQELQAIYDEFCIHANQIEMLKPFIENLINVSNGAESIFNKDKFIERKRRG